MLLIFKMLIGSVFSAGQDNHSEMASLIEYRNVTITHGAFTVLKNVDMEIGSGQMVYLVGSVGSGKSSLIQSIYAEVSATGDQVRVLDYDMQRLRRKDIPMLRRRLGIVFQDFRLLTDRNVYANLEFVLLATGWSKDAATERIDYVLQQVDMSDKGYKMPHELSGGEQQRVAIARALLGSPDMILADEPTGNLDPETGRQIFALLSQIASAGTSVIIATHNHSLIDDFPGRVLICEDHRLSEIP